MNLQLHVGERNDVQNDRAGIVFDYARKVHDFLFCHFTGVRRAVEMYCVKLQTAFCHHIRGNRAVYAAGKKHHARSRSADRHAACAHNFVGEKIGKAVFPYVHVKIGVKNVEIDG